jgi:hypothetical protein
MNITKQMIVEGLKQAKWDDQIKRQKEARKYIDYYNNRQDEGDGRVAGQSYLKELVAKMFPLTKADMFPYCRTYPITEQIINDASILFNNPPRITINPADALDSADPKVLLFQQEIVDKPMLNATLIQVNRYTNLLNKIAVMPKWYETGKAIEYVILTPDKVMVLQDPDSPQHINAILYALDPLQDTIGYTARADRYMMITDEEWAEVKISRGQPEIVKSDKNPYGFIPVAWFQNSLPIDGFWIDKGNPIVEANEHYNVYKTLEKLAITYQMYSTLVTIDIPAEAQIPWGVRAVLNLSGDQNNPNVRPDAKYITPDPKLTEVSTIIEGEIDQMAGYAGLSKEAYRNEVNSFTSGYHLELSKQEVINNAELEKPFYTKGLTDLLTMACRIYTHHNPTNTLESVTDFAIDYKPIEFKRNPMEVWQVRILEKQNGIKSNVDFVMEDNPDLTRDEAIQRLQQVEADKTEIGGFTTAPLDEALGITE